MPGHARKAWFAPKRFGYGAGLPIAWQGWIVMLTFLTVMAGSFVLHRSLHRFGHPGWTMLATMLIDLAAVIVLLVICARTTEGGWRWRWGRDA